jgi:hypothetical protein
MPDENQSVRRTKAWRDKKRDDTETAFRSISDKERTDRLRKTEELRKLREEAKGTQ